MAGNRTNLEPKHDQLRKQKQKQRHNLQSVEDKFKMVLCQACLPLGIPCTHTLLKTEESIQLSAGKH